VVYGVTGSFGGEINQILKAPTDTLLGNVGFEFGDFDRQRVEADVAGPIPGTSDKLRGRLVGTYGDAGLFQNTVVDTNDIDKLFYGTVTYDFSASTNVNLHSCGKTAISIRLTAARCCSMQTTGCRFLARSRSGGFYCGDPKQNHATLTNDFGMVTLRAQTLERLAVRGQVAASKTERFLRYVYAFGPAGAFDLADSEVYLLSYVEDTEDESLTSTLSLGGDFELANRTHQFLAALEYQTESSRRRTTSAPASVISTCSKMAAGA